MLKKRKSWKEEGWKEKPLWWDEIYSCWYCDQKEFAHNLHMIVIDLHGKASACDDCLPKHEESIRKIKR